MADETAPDIELELQFQREIELFSKYAVSHENQSSSQIFCPWF